MTKIASRLSHRFRKSLAGKNNQPAPGPHLFGMGAASRFNTLPYFTPLISFSSKNVCFSTPHEGLYSPNTFDVTLVTFEAAFVIADEAELAASRRNLDVSMPEIALPRPVFSEAPLRGDPLLDGAFELDLVEGVPEPEGPIPESKGVSGGESPSGGMRRDDGIATVGRALGDTPPPGDIE